MRASGYREFPPRLPEQPFFYPVLNEDYATQIARDWNTKDERSGFAGYVLRFEDGRALYFAGDTNVFTDMQLIEQLYHPELAFLPIGDHYTMGPEEAAYAGRLLKVKQIIPMHYGTFPVLTGHPQQLEAKLAGSGIQVLTLKQAQPITW